MPLRLKLSLVLLAGALACSAQAAHTQARLLLAADTARPGDTVMAGVLLRMDKGWHTYWRNSGGSGMPTTIDWELPAGIKPENILWPVPEKLPDKELTTYVYEHEALLLIPLKLDANLKPGPIQLEAKVSWLECEVSCVPGNATVRATLQVGAETKLSKDADALKAAEAKLPKPGDSLVARAWWEKMPKADLRPLLLEWSTTTTVKDADFFPDANEQFEIQPITERLPAAAGKILLRAQVKKLQGEWPKEVSGLLIQNSGTKQEAFDVKLPIMESGPAVITAAGGAPSLWQMLLYAFIGGLILNVMPCVLPVIALKILGFVGQAKDEPGRVRVLGLIYGMGVLFSFLVLALLVVGVKAAGHQAGWGMQFGNPQFLVILTVLVTLVALNLFGLFEVNVSGRVLGAAGSLSAKHGPAGAFFNGVLATLLATPCTAPFLGAALGFAFAQSTAIVILILLTVGLGLASPYVVLSWNPAWLKFMPRPGAWMEKFKIAMGFPMLATAFWLFSLIPIHYGDRSWWLGIFLVVIALAAWIYGEFAQRGRKHPAIAMALALALVITGYVLVVEGRLHWRVSEMADSNATKVTNDPNGIQWEPWSTNAVAKARAEKRPVVVDFTAKWCLTCNTIVKPALESSLVRKKINDTHALALLADYTLRPANITQELNRFGRAGVPVVLVYPRDASQAPMVFDVVTPGTVVEALDRAAQ